MTLRAVSPLSGVPRQAAAVAADRAFRPGVASRTAVLLLAGAGVALRLPSLVAPAGNDEGGYLAVAHQWHHGGPSLYGAYWVDRPPVLIGLFQLADLAGGLPALRVLGALAAGLATLGVAASAYQVGGRRAAVWSAAVSAALFVSPQLGTVQVNGELLAAPFIAWSIAGWLRAVATTGRRAHLAAAGAGALAVAALLVKQNMAEPLVFGAVLVVGVARTGAWSPRRVGRLLLAAASGAGSVLLAITAWTVAHGTSPVGVVDAMYGFRLRAAGVLATTVDHGQAHRSTVFLASLLTSGLVLVPPLLAWWWARRRLRGPVAWALSATLLWSAVSMLVSGGFWDHYLVEAVVPVGLAVGVLVSSPEVRPAHVLPRLVGVLVVLLALGHWVAGEGARATDAGESLGSAIGSAARPGDTLVSAVGDGQTVEASGLRSPYPFLWTLPAQVYDPDLRRLAALLEGPEAPTWLVTWSRPTFPAAARARLAAAVAADYRPVAVVCGHPVYLRDGVVRPPPRPSTGCVAPSSVLARVDLDVARR
jgi:hypothetical protein